MAADREYPRMLYRMGSTVQLESGRFDLLPVKDKAELDAALSDGWCIDQNAAAVPGVAPVAEPEASAEPTRAELEQQATALGIKFDGRTGDKKLAASIAEAMKA